MNLFAIGLTLVIGLIVANRFSRSRNSNSFYLSRRHPYINSSRCSRATNGDGGGWGGDGDGDSDGGNGGGDGGE